MSKPIRKKSRHKHKPSGHHVTSHEEIHKMPENDMWKTTTIILGVLLLLSVFTNGFRLGISVNSIVEDLNTLEGKELPVEVKTAVSSAITELEAVADAKPAEPAEPSEPSEPSEPTDPVYTGDAIQILEFSEFACQYCGAAAGFHTQLIGQFQGQDPNWLPSVPNIKKNYGDKVEVVFKHFIVHESARKASEASECARDQGRFWDYHDVLFQNQGALDVDSLKKYASDMGFDMAEFSRCLDNNEKASIVVQDTQEGRSLGVGGTPTFFVGGEEGYMIRGAASYSQFPDKINNVLAGQMPAPPPTKGPTIGTFQSLILDEGICHEDGKPVIRLLSTTWCPHCKWIMPTFDGLMKELIDEEKVVAYHWELDIGDNTLTEEVETEVPVADLEYYQLFNERGSIPTFVFGCKYFRIGNGYESADDLAAEEQDFRDVIDALITEIEE